MTRVAVVGAGYFGQFHYDAWSRIAEAELVALAALSGGEDTARRFKVPAVYADTSRMVHETRPDLVDVTAPPSAHAELIGTLAPSVKWIICQKPFCRSPDEARRVVDLVRAQGARLIIHENFRFQPWYREIRRLMDEKTIGEPFQITFRLRPGDGQGQNAYLDRQPYFREMERFLIHETGVHWIDTFRYLMGEVTALTASLRQLNPAIAGEDAGVLQFEFANGTRGLLDGNRLADHAASNRRLTMGELELEGSGGAIRLDGDGLIWRRTHGSNDWREHAYEWRDNLFGGDCVYLTCKAALAAFHSGEPAETEAGAYLRNLDLVEAAYRSHAERRWIDV